MLTCSERWVCLWSEKEGWGVFEDVIMAGCQAALRFFLFSLLLCFDVEAESRRVKLCFIKSTK